MTQGERVSAAGLIEAAAAGWARPLTPSGSISVIRRAVLPFQQAGLFPVVVLTGAEDAQVRRQLSDTGVIFLRCQADEPIDAIRIGLDYLADKCRRVVYTPANTPFFHSQTILRLLEGTGEAVIPTCQGRAGHPILLDAAAFSRVTDYRGEGGLRGALEQLDCQRMEVADQGVLMSARDAGAMEGNVRSHNATLLQPVVHLGISRESLFYDRRVKLLLYLISDTCNLRLACQYMDLSVGKGWNLLNDLERELGYPVVQRRQGGRGGGQTTLTPAGRVFLEAAEEFEAQVYACARDSFRTLFQDSGILG